MFAAFSPAPTDIHNILDRVCDPTRSIATVAEQEQTSISALCAWLALPEIAAALEQMAASCARRVRVLASAQMSLVAEAARAIVQGVARDEALLAQQPAAPATLTQRTAARRIGNAAMKLLHQLTTFGLRPAPRTTRAPRPLPSHIPPTSLPEADCQHPPLLRSKPS